MLATKEKHQLSNLIHEYNTRFALQSSIKTKKTHKTFKQTSFSFIAPRIYIKVPSKRPILPFIQNKN